MIGLEQKYEHSSSQNPLPWTVHWFNSRSLQNAPQETEIESYVIGGVKQDVTKDQFKRFTIRHQQIVKSINNYKFKKNIIR